MEHLGELSQRNEGYRDVPWTVDDAPVEFIEQKLKGLVGIEIDVTSLVGQWKFSQNKSAQDIDSVGSGLLSENTEQAKVVSNMVNGLKN